MQIISNKEYKKLKDIENKYNELIGQQVTVFVGGRTLRARLINLSKEELIRIILDLKSRYGWLCKEYDKNICQRNTHDKIKNYLRLLKEEEKIGAAMPSEY